MPNSSSHRQDQLAAEIRTLLGSGLPGDARSLAALARSSLLGCVAADVLAGVAGRSRIAFFPDGATIVTEREVDDLGVFVLARGTAAVSIDDRPLGMLRRGDAFGVVATLDGGTRTATVRAAGAVRCVVLSTACFHELLHDAPSLARRLLVELAGLLRPAAARPASSSSSV